MVVNAQFGKQKALQQLRALFLQQPLNQETLEVHHRVLSALLSLCRHPLQHKYTVPLFLSKHSPISLLAPGTSTFCERAYKWHTSQGAATSMEHSHPETLSAPPLPEGCHATPSLITNIFGRCTVLHCRYDCAGGGECDAGSDVSELSAWDDETAAGQALDVDELSDWSEDDSDVITARVEHAAAAAPPIGTKPGKELLLLIRNASFVTRVHQHDTSVTSTKTGT